MAEVEEETKAEPPTAGKAYTPTFTFCGETVKAEVVNPFMLEQPENDPASDPATFRIGQRNQRTGYREAIPRWRWPNPGQPGSQELIAEYEEGLALWMEAAQTLTRFLRTRASAAYDLEHGNDYPTKKRDEEWAWLCGLWQARGMAIPDRETIHEEIYGTAKR